jgi:hypothetical protein
VLACTLALLVGLVGCGEKAAAPGPDAGDASTAAKDSDAAALPFRADASVTVDDLAVPAPANEDLSTRMRHLLEALAQNNAELANDALFPRDAFVATRDSADPQKAWDKKLSGLFRKSVERTHKRTKGIESAKFVSFELGHPAVQASPKKNEWKRPLWKVKRSKLTFTVEGKAHHLEIAEMTAWRGAWYVTRLR